MIEHSGVLAGWGLNEKKAVMTRYTLDKVRWHFVTCGNNFSNHHFNLCRADEVWACTCLIVGNVSFHATFRRNFLTYVYARRTSCCEKENSSKNVHAFQSLSAGNLIWSWRGLFMAHIPSRFMHATLHGLHYILRISLGRRVHYSWFFCSGYGQRRPPVVPTHNMNGQDQGSTNYQKEKFNKITHKTHVSMARWWAVWLVGTESWVPQTTW